MPSKSGADPNLRARHPETPDSSDVPLGDSKDFLARLLPARLASEQSGVPQVALILAGAR